MITANIIRPPPIVGVPAFEKWLEGPSSLTTWPICLTFSFLINQGEKIKLMIRAVSKETIALKVI